MNYINTYIQGLCPNSPVKTTGLDTSGIGYYTPPVNLLKDISGAFTQMFRKYFDCETGG